MAWGVGAQAWKLRLAGSSFRATESSLLEKNVLFKAKSKCCRCPGSMSAEMYLVIFPETVSTVGGADATLMPRGAHGNATLRVHGLLWPGKGSVLMGLLFLASGGEHAVAAEGSF